MRNSDVKKYIHSLWEYPTYRLTDTDEAIIKKSGVTEYIYRRLLSNRFRKSAPSPEVLASVERRVVESVKAETPIHLTIPTGGYKKWQLKSAPEVDWAELFHLRFMLEYMAPIVAAYAPGVRLDYFSNAWILRYISYYPQEDLDAYTNSFRRLLWSLRPNWPKNIEINYNVVAEQKPGDELLSRVLKNRAKIEAEWITLSEEQKREKLKYAERNIRWDILEKSGSLSAQERNKYIYEGKIIHDAMLLGGWNNDLYYLRSDNGIGIIHRNSDPYFLHLATVAGSFVQFWAGTGVLENKGEVYIPRVLSYKQYLEIEEKSVNMPTHLAVGGNLGNIAVFPPSLAATDG